MKRILIILALLCTLSIHSQNYLKEGNEISLNIGDKYKELELPDKNGKLLKLSDYCGKGNYTLIEFGGSWCGPCKWDAPKLKTLYDKYHSHGMEMISILAEVNKESWGYFISRHGINWPQISDIKGWDFFAKEIYGVRSIPVYVILDPQGYVIFLQSGNMKGDNNHLEPKLQEIYGF